MLDPALHTTVVEFTRTQSLGSLFACLFVVLIFHIYFVGLALCRPRPTRVHVISS